ncbi:hypothetical protein PAPYR_5536 [Paratrimastix pyriformis]|uniref:Uncharacterized protein n=1 Tax=Paratrimastix pyriformis TaxID=342808 RepID=A0ABQ8UH46_9EUKA|nr:hypothetical protein PAPYR_5536 [Paratrimastix pyriformis]
MPFPFLKLFRKLTFWDERGYLKVSKKLNSVWSAISVSLGHPTATPLRHLSGLTIMCNPHPYILPWPLIHPDVLLLIWLPTLACPDCWVHHPPLQTSPPSFKWHRRVPFPLWTCENASFDKQEESEPPQENTNLSHNIVRVWISLPFSFLSVLLRAGLTLAPFLTLSAISCLLGHLVLCSAKSWGEVVRALSTRPQQDRVDPLSPPKLSLHVREYLVKLGLQIGEPVNQLNLSFPSPSLPLFHFLALIFAYPPFSSGNDLSVGYGVKLTAGAAQYLRLGRCKNQNWEWLRDIGTAPMILRKPIPNDPRLSPAPEYQLTHKTNPASQTSPNFPAHFAI